MGNTGHKMLGKELKSRGNRHKRLKMVEKVISHLFVYCGAILALPEAFFFGYSGAILWAVENLFLLSTAAQNMRILL